MLDFKNFNEWFKWNAPQDAQEKSDLLYALEHPMDSETYSSRQNGSSLILTKGENCVRLRRKSEIREAYSIVDDYDVYDEDDLAEGYKRAMERGNND